VEFLANRWFSPQGDTNKDRQSPLRRAQLYRSALRELGHEVAEADTAAIAREKFAETHELPSS
jgi:hypothetical protein